MKGMPTAETLQSKTLFPGHRAGASLKGAGVDLGRRCRRRSLPRPPSRGLIEGIPASQARNAFVRPLPRPPSRGLIEGLLPGPGPGLDKLALPRPPSRGLIEGPSTRSTRRWRSPPLPRPPSRGLIEGLRAAPRRLCGVDHPLPRPPSRGLIEGAPARPTASTRSGLFPGHRAGASLKATEAKVEAAQPEPVSSPATEPGPH